MVYFDVLNTYVVTIHDQTLSRLFFYIKGNHVSAENPKNCSIKKCMHVISHTTVNNQKRKTTANLISTKCVYSSEFRINVSDTSDLLRLQILYPGTDINIIP